MSTRTKAVKALFGFSLPTWINAVIGIVAVPLVTRLFSPDELGKINLFCTYGSILFCIALAGMNQGFMRFYNEPLSSKTAGGLFKLCLLISIVFTLIIGLMIFICRYNLSIAITGDYYVYIPICLVIYVLSCVILNMINAAYRMQCALMSYGIMTILMNICGKVTYAAAAMFSNKVFSAILLLTITHLLLVIFYSLKTIHYYKDEKPVIDKNSVTQLLKYSLPLIPVIFIAQINTALPKIVISSLLDYSYVGIYAAAYSVVSIISIVQSGINVFWAPFVYNNYKENPSQLQSGHLIITYVMTVFGLAVVLFQDIIYMIIGASYRSSQEFFSLLLFSPICYTISETTGIGINISKKTYLNIIVYTVTIVITVLTSYLLIPRFGLVGAAMSVAISSFFMLIVRTILGEKYFKVIVSPFKSFFSPVLFLLVVSLNTVFFNLFWARTLITVLVLVIICIVYHKELFKLVSMMLEMLREAKSKRFLKGLNT